MGADHSTPQGASTDQDRQQGDASPLLTAAIQLHELFTAYVAGGFTEDQALTIIARLGR